MVAQLAFSDIILFKKWLNLINYELIDATFNEYQFHYTSSFLHIIEPKPQPRWPPK